MLYMKKRGTKSVLKRWIQRLKDVDKKWWIISIALLLFVLIVFL